MKISSQTYKSKGMRRDDSYSSFNPEYSWDNKNIRLTARDSNDLLSVTNEKGNSQLSFNDVSPIRVVDYAYTYLFKKFLWEESAIIYEYESRFDNYLIEQSDGWTPPASSDYTYQIQFINYLAEQENI